ncbi:MAG: CPBP family intramembrane metalloprotease [Butyrivibrio sp.]|nr:CPBP family intramembrane metalloprotease [Butyrivibrio sp.]
MGNTVQAFLFGLMHGVPFGLATGSVWAFLLLTMLPGLFGAYMGWMNEKKFGGSIIPSWILHGCMNFMTAIMSLI